MSKPHVLAFYLPQFHPVKENNEWFGEGFTEWTNVAKAKSLFKGHVQPRVPADLGFYDLRIPEVREHQASLAKEAGISAFCYYHYWFGDGRMILEKPLEMVIKEKKPDFPFCIAWANHSWYKKAWNPDTKNIDQKLLLEQRYPQGQDTIDHFNYLLPAFKDERYYKIDGRNVFVIYNSIAFPDFDQFKKTWNELAKLNGLPEFYFLSYTADIKVAASDVFSDYDGCIVSLITNVANKKVINRLQIYKKIIKSKISELFHYPLMVYSYEKAMPYLLDEVERKDNVIPVLVPNWDYTPRRGAGDLILKDSTPELFAKHVRQALDLIKDKPQEKQILFIKSWNEWGEGNYMEPDIYTGKGYINALRQELDNYSDKE